MPAPFVRGRHFSFPRPPSKSTGRITWCWQLNARTPVCFSIY